MCVRIDRGNAPAACLGKSNLLAAGCGRIYWNGTAAVLLKSRLYAHPSVTSISAIFNPFN